MDVAGQGGVVQQAVAQLPDPGAQGIVVVEALDEILDVVVEAQPHLVVRVGRHLRDQVGHSGHDLAGQLACDRLVQPGDPQYRPHLRTDPRRHHLLGRGVGEEGAQIAQHAVQQGLVPALVGHQPEHLGRQAGQVHALQLFAGQALQEAVQPVAVEQGQHVRGQLDHQGARLPSVAGIGQRVGHPPGRVELLQLADHLAPLQEVLADEVGQGAAQLRLAPRDDRGVRDPALAQRVAEQRDHREPVRQPADHRRLGHGDHQAEAPVRRPQLQPAAGDEHQRGRHQHGDGDALAAGQRERAGGGRFGRRHGRIIAARAGRTPPAAA